MEREIGLAELVAAEEGIPASRSVSAALAVLSGIASADAACCAALGRRSRGEDHREAVALLRQIVPELQQVVVGQGRLDRGDQIIALFENRNSHTYRGSLSTVCSSTTL